MDTEKDVGGAPVQTSFQFPTNFRDFEHPTLLIERGMYKPPSAECLAPFHQDHTQQIVVWFITHPSGYLVFPVEALLRLAEGREGYKPIGWDEWKIHVVTPSIPDPDIVRVWVSGCRLFCINSIVHDEVEVEVEVYDFSLQGRAKYVTEHANADLGGVRHLVSTGTCVRPPWNFFDIDGGHDSVLFFCVSVLLFSCTMRLTDVAQASTGPNGEDENVLHIWSL